MVRFPEIERKSISNLEDMYIRTPDGSQVPFYSVASFEIARGFSIINRYDGRRNVSVSADINRSIARPEDVVAALESGLIRELATTYPNVEIEMGGEQEERNKSLSGLAIGSLLSLLLIYCLLAIPLSKATRNP